MNNIKSNLVTGVVFSLMLGGFTYVVLDAAELPDVWFSHSTGECVKVLNYADIDAYNCENLPSRFYHVWVK